MYINAPVRSFFELSIPCEIEIVNIILIKKRKNMNITKNNKNKNYLW